MQNRKRWLAALLCAMMLMAAALVTAGCSADKGQETAAAEETTAPAEESAVLGEGETQFALTVVDPEGQKTAFEIHTDETTVGAALVGVGLIEGEDGPYGLYIKTVNGIIVDYDKDGKYWAFYVNDEYANASVDLADIQEGDSYALKAE